MKIIYPSFLPSLASRRLHWLSALVVCGLACWLSCSSFMAVQAQGFYTDFGKQTVQYKNFIWSYYESPNFVTYFYQGGQDLGKFTVLTAEKYLADVESKLEFNSTTKVEIIVYHDLSDQRQTNIGIALSESNSGGVTKIVGNKMFVHFNGNHNDLAEQIKAGVTRIFLERLLHGGNIQEVLQNAVLLNLPPWFTNGLISYVGKPWSAKLDNRLKEAFNKENLVHFNQLRGEEATFAGHAFWNYIAQMHGPAAIPNLLYITRVNRSLESGFLFVLGTSLNETIYEFNEYYKNVFTTDNTVNKLPATALLSENLVLKGAKHRPRKHEVLKAPSISPNGRYVSYAIDDKGRQKIFLYDTETKKRKLLVATGYKSYNMPTAANYPLIAWHKNGAKLAIVYVRRDEMQLLTYNVATGEQLVKPIVKFQQVVDIAFTASDEKLIMAAVKEGQTDVYLYELGNTKTTQITNDFWDERQVQYVNLANGMRGYVFASNRPNDTLQVEKLDSTLPIGNYDLFFKSLGSKNSNVLVRLTDTPLANEQLPIQYDSLRIAYISDLNGINNVYVCHIDSSFLREDVKVYYQDSTVLNPSYSLQQPTIAAQIDTIVRTDVYKFYGQSQAITNYKDVWLQSIAIAKASNEMLQLFFKDKQYLLYKQALPNILTNTFSVLPKTTYRKQLENKQTTNNPLPNSLQLLPLTGPKVINDSSLEPNNNLLNQQETIILKPAPLQNEEQQKSLVTNFFEEEAITEPVKTDSLPSAPLSEADKQAKGMQFQSDFDFLPNYNSTANKAISQDPMAAQQTAPTNTAQLPPTNNTNTTLVLSTEEDKPLFKRTKVRKYKTQFSIDNFATQLNNTIIFNQYQPFRSTGPGYTMPNLNALSRFGVTDLMENHKLIGGFRMPFDLRGSEFFVEYRALETRLDKRYTIYRKQQRNTYLVDTNIGAFSAEARNINTIVQTSYIYAIDEIRSVRGHLGYRSDKINFLATDDATLLALAPFQENYFYAKLEYVFDNTIPIQANILNGSRYKIYSEFFKPFDGLVNDREFSLKFKDTGWLGTFGVDFRHYQPVHRQITWANRFATAMSYGTRKVLYYLGGVEGWLGFDPASQYNNTTPIDADTDYAFESLGTNLRGFRQNVRNGSSFAVFNSELRIPLFSYLSKVPIRSEFFRNLQIVGFVDVGAAWQGVSPFNEDNLYQTIVLGQPPVQVSVQYFKDPIVYGYGTGIRSKLLGYFVRLDTAWGVDSGARLDNRWYVSLGLDF